MAVQTHASKPEGPHVSFTDGKPLSTEQDVMECLRYQGSHQNRNASKDNSDSKRGLRGTSSFTQLELDSFEICVYVNNALSQYGCSEAVIVLAIAVPVSCDIDRKGAHRRSTGIVKNIISPLFRRSRMICR